MNGKVWNHIMDALRDGPMHMTLLDPAASKAKHAEEIAIEAARAGTHAFMVGGSTGITHENLDTLVAHIKEATHLPVIYFPSSAGAFSPRMDAVYFMSTLNSRNPRFISGEQSRGAPLLKALGVETIPMGYLIVEPGMTVGKVSEADLLPHTPEGAELAAGYALAAEMMGMRLVYLEAGSGATAHVPVEMVRAVKDATSIPLVVGGGITSGEAAGRILDAGADILVTGTIAENGDWTRLRAVAECVNARRMAPAPASE